MSSKLCLEGLQFEEHSDVKSLESKLKRPEVLYGALPMADHGCCLELHPLQAMDRNQVRDRALPLADHGCYVELHPFQAKDKNLVRDGGLPQWLQGTTRKLDMLL